MHLSFVIIKVYCGYICIFRARLEQNWTDNQKSTAKVKVSLFLWPLFSVCLQVHSMFWWGWRASPLWILPFGLSPDTRGPNGGRQMLRSIRADPSRCVHESLHASVFSSGVCLFTFGYVSIFSIAFSDTLQGWGIYKIFLTYAWSDFYCIWRFEHFESNTVALQLKWSIILIQLDRYRLVV